MPSHRKASKKSSGPKRLHSDLEVEVAQASGWSQIVQLIQNQLQIPDLSKKSGLKKVFANFDATYERLDAIFQQYVENDRIVGGIVGIYTQMCEDSVLRTKLCSNGLLARLFPVLKRDACRTMALHTLVNIGHHGGVGVHAEIAKHASLLVQTLLDYPDDPQSVEYVILILSHSVGAVVNGDSQAPEMPDIHRSLDMRIILKLVTFHMRQPYASGALIDHGIQLIFAASMHCAADFRAEPDLDKFLNWGLRGSCLGALIRSFVRSSVPERLAMGPAQTMQLMSNQPWPAHLQKVLSQYGLPRCYTTQERAVSYELSEVLGRGMQHRDFYLLGGKLASLTLLSEYTMPETILPAFSVIEVVPFCIKELRAKGTPSDMEKADILEMKLLVKKQQWDEIKSKAHQFLERNPHAAYTYYALSLTPGSEEALRAAKKGLKCKQTTPFLHFQLLRLAVEFAGDLGLCYFQEFDDGRMMWEEAIAFLMSALEDSKAFIEQAPPDNPYMKTILYWNIILTIVMDGPDANLKAVEGALEKLKISEQVNEHMKMPILSTQMRMAAKLIVKLYDEAVKDLGEGVKLMDERLDEQVPPPDFPKKASDELAAWLSDMSLGSFNCSDGPKPQINVKDIWFKRCSYCRNPSAVLRKCSGCQLTRYCDNNCQKLHWAEHKKQCKTKS
ncbi:hypothetical protein BDP27DRAFT_1335047 [Rhodocollybia butyracea]|uniref:MYND-type domain-containing protein n=1 Tax=Rhodocollybia butyracea TaxID=206335 RepID=A0A9P5U1C2_9AGAR|nr:hypothetical protein BDP27DRAFT_1335047 [Rhodocollybia butyracea]